MPSDRKPSLILPVAAVAMLLAMYVGAYYALVRPTRYFLIPGRNPKYAIQLSVSGHPEYYFFLPIHWLDRRIRPHVWEPPAP